MSVVAFPTKPPADEDQLVWRCNCGCLTHYMRADGEMECANCGHLSYGAPSEWRRRLPPPPRNVPDALPGDLIVTNLADPVRVIRRILNNVDPDILSALIVINSDGSLTTWADKGTLAESPEWLAGRLDEAKRIIGL